jgi:hypothetical protein
MQKTRRGGLSAMAQKSSNSMLKNCITESMQFAIYKGYRLHQALEFSVSFHCFFFEFFRH